MGKRDPRTHGAGRPLLHALEPRLLLSAELTLVMRPESSLIHAIEGNSHKILLASDGTGSESISSWSMDWSDGTGDTLEGNPRHAYHTYANGPAGYAITATATNATGTYDARWVTGRLDTAFGTNGTAASGLGTTAKAMFPMADGKFLGVGKDDVTFVRFNADGSMDTSFGTGGMVRHTVTGAAEAATVVGTTPTLVNGTFPQGEASLQVHFSETVLGAEDPANYLLSRPGPDLLLGTGDDTAVSVGASYEGNVATITFAAMNEDIYRLVIRDTITDSSSQALDGDEDGAAGGNWVRDFVVPASLLDLVGTFDPAAKFPTSVAVADFNEDGKQDMAVPCLGDHRVAVLLDDGLGSFALAGSMPTGGFSPAAIIADDFNADGHVDLAVSNWSSDNVGVLLGNGDGTFQGAVTYAVGGKKPERLAAVDLNHDGSKDLVVAVGAAASIATLFNNGSGQFGSPALYPSGGVYAFGVAVDDFNKDGNSDIAVTHNDSTGKVGILLAGASGGFLPVETFSTYYSPLGISTGDFDDDGMPDLVLAGGAVQVFRSVGSGNFTLAATLPKGEMAGPARSVVVGDFNGDGKNDIAAGGFEEIIVYLRTGPNHFTSNMRFAAGGTAIDTIATADFNQDGRADVAAANRGSHSVGVLLSSSTFTPCPLASPHGLAFDVQVGGAMGMILSGGPGNAFDAYGQLQLNGTPFATYVLTPSYDDAGQTVVTPLEQYGRIMAHREITVPGSGEDDLARIMDVLRNTASSPIGVTVRFVGNLGSDASTTIFATSDEDLELETSDMWFGTDDNEGSQTSAIIHIVHGPSGQAPVSIISTGDNVAWTYDLTIPANQSVGLVHYVVCAPTRAEAVASVNRLVDGFGFGGQASAFLTAEELSRLVNFQLGAPPIAVDDSFAVDEDSTLLVSTPGILANDSHSDGTLLTAGLLASPAHSEAFLLNADGSFTYSPLANWTGTDTFTYRASDGVAWSNVATVTITVNPVNDPPIATIQYVSTYEDEPRTFTAAGNDTDGDTLTFAVVSQPSHGSVTMQSGGSFTYSPGADYNGSDSFTFKVNDGQAGSAPATVTITVSPVNDAPVADPQRGTTVPDVSLSGMVNGQDVEGDPLTYSIVDQPAHGIVTMQPSGAFTYTPAPGFCGEDVFTFQASDAQGSSLPAAFTVTVLDGAGVVDRRVFYNNSAFDGNDPAAGAGDDGAVAPHTAGAAGIFGHGHDEALDEPAKQLGKDALLPGQTARFANYTSYCKGLNGIMVDIRGLANPDALSAADFQFRTGNSDSLGGWAAASAPLGVSVRAGAGTGGSHRVTILWADNDLDGAVEANEAVAGAWLEVTVLATENTGLAAADVFYFGNAVGEGGNAIGDALVNATDELGARNRPHWLQAPAGVSDPYDYNRDTKVDATDQLIARHNQTYFLTALSLIAAPSPAGGSSIGGAAVASGASLPTVAVGAGVDNAAAALFAAEAIGGRAATAGGLFPSAPGGQTIQRWLRGRKTGSGELAIGPSSEAISV